MNNPATDRGRPTPRIRRSRRGWGQAARLALAMLACTFAGAGQAQVDDYPNLDRAVDGLASKLVAKGSLQGKTVLVRPGDFFEMGSERSLPLSEHLAWKFITDLRSYGAEPVSGSADESKAITLLGRWRIESGSGKLLLSVEVKQLGGDGLNERRPLATRQARVPVANIDPAYLEPDLGSHGRHVVRQLEKRIEKYVSGNGRFRLHILPFKADGIPEPERFNRYLLGKWRPAFADSHRFEIVVGTAEFDGELHGEFFVSGRRIDASLFIRDNQRVEVAAATVEMDSGLFPSRIAGIGVKKTKDEGEAVGAVEQVVPPPPPPDHMAAERALGLDRGAKMLVQRSLGALGFDAGPVDGAFGPKTRGAIGAWQEAKGYGVTGYLTDGQAEVLREFGRDAEAEAARRREEERKERMRVGRRFRDCAGCPELVVVREGTYMMGSPSSEEGREDDEGPVHRVRIGRPFAVGVKEVTVGEYGRFVSESRRSMGDPCWTYEGGKWEERSGRNWRNPGFGQTDKHPVVCVNWNDAKAYVDWLSGETGEEYRLLSESEWEYVARGGTKTARYWGEGEWGQCRYANGADEASGDMGIGKASCDDGHARTAPVGSFAPNEYKLHDVLGNVWEWVEDCWNDSYSGAPTDGSARESGNCDKRVVRGGSWNYISRNLRSAERGLGPAGARVSRHGFRIARTLTP